MKTLNYTPVNNIEKMLFVMPKNCNCPICKETKEKAKKDLGIAKYEKITRELGFAC